MDLCSVETKIREKQANTCSPGTVILIRAAVNSWCKARDSIIVIAAHSSEQLSASKGDANCKLHLLQLKLLLWSFRASQQLETLTGGNTFYVCVASSASLGLGHTAIGPSLQQSLALGSQCLLREMCFTASRGEDGVILSGKCWVGLASPPLGLAHPRGSGVWWVFLRAVCRGRGVRVAGRR